MLLSYVQFYETPEQISYRKHSNLMSSSLQLLNISYRKHSNLMSSSMQLLNILVTENTPTSCPVLCNS